MEGLLGAFITLIVIMDPIGLVPFIITLSKGMPIKEVRANINASVSLAGMMLFLFLFFGIDVFGFFRINLDSFQIAGGIILLIIGVLYVFGIHHRFIKTQGNDLSIPLGTPLLTGPGYNYSYNLSQRRRLICNSLCSAFGSSGNLAYFG